MEIQRRISFGFRLEVSGFIFMYIFIFFSLSLSLSLSLFRLFDSEIGPEIVLFSLLDRLFFSSSLKFYQFCIALLETLRQFL